MVDLDFKEKPEPGTPSQSASQHIQLRVTGVIPLFHFLNLYPLIINEPARHERTYLQGETHVIVPKVNERLL
jgi:hypothetical protein